MKKVRKTNKIPAESNISQGFGKYHHCDSFSVKTGMNISIDMLTTKIFQTPKWADALMRFRNSFFKLFGLKKGGYKKDTYVSEHYPIGSRAVYFTVIDRYENEIVMQEKDKHLNFRTSVLKVTKDNGLYIHLTTLVQYNNFLGRFYFFVIKPFHGLIIRYLMKRIGI